jgi:hypothetical protein
MKKVHRSVSVTFCSRLKRIFGNSSTKFYHHGGLSIDRQWLVALSYWFAWCLTCKKKTMRHKFVCECIDMCLWPFAVVWIFFRNSLTKGNHHGGLSIDRRRFVALSYWFERLYSCEKKTAHFLRKNRIEKTWKVVVKSYSKGVPTSQQSTK